MLLHPNKTNPRLEFKIPQQEGLSQVLSDHAAPHFGAQVLPCVLSQPPLLHPCPALPWGDAEMLSEIDWQGIFCAAQQGWAELRALL